MVRAARLCLFSAPGRWGGNGCEEHETTCEGAESEALVSVRALVVKDEEGDGEEEKVKEEKVNGLILPLAIPS